MDRLAQANALIDAADAGASDLESRYQAALQEKTVASELQIAIKNVIENLRSALDYTARAIYEHLGGSPGPRIYYPIARPGASSADFPGLANRNIPGVGQAPTILAALEATQEFANAANRWLPNLATLANENKHENLTPQVRSEDKRVTVETAGGGSVSWGSGVKFGGDVRIGGVPIDISTQLPVPHPSQVVRQGIWVDFAFDSTGDSVLPFLGTATRGARDVLDRITSVL